MFDKRLRVLAAGAFAAAICVLGGTAHQASGSGTPLSPQSVLDWNTHAWTLISQAQHPREVTPPATRNIFQTEGLIYLSYVQAAVYDADVAIEGRYQPYGFSLFAPQGASPAAAVAAAAHDMLNYYVTEFPTIRRRRSMVSMQPRWRRIPDGQAKTDGISVGQAAALGVTAIRSNDGRNAPTRVYGNPGPRRARTVADRPTGDDRADALGRVHAPVPARAPVAVPARPTAGSEQLDVQARPGRDAGIRSQGEHGTHDARAHAGADRHGLLLERQCHQPVQPGAPRPRHATRHGSRPRPRICSRMGTWS